MKAIKRNILLIHRSSVTPPTNVLGILLSDHLSPLLYKSKSPCWKCFHISLHRSRLVSYSCGWEKKKWWWDQEVSNFYFKWCLHLWYEETVLRRLLGAEKGTCTKLSQMLLNLLCKHNESHSSSGLIYTQVMFIVFICYSNITASSLHPWHGTNIAWVVGYHYRKNYRQCTLSCFSEECGAMCAFGTIWTRINRNSLVFSLKSVTCLMSSPKKNEAIFMLNLDLFF